MTSLRLLKCASRLRGNDELRVRANQVARLPDFDSWLFAWDDGDGGATMRVRREQGRAGWRWRTVAATGIVRAVKPNNADADACEQRK